MPSHSRKLVSGKRLTGQRGNDQLQGQSNHPDAKRYCGVKNDKSRNFLSDGSISRNSKAHVVVPTHRCETIVPNVWLSLKVYNLKEDEFPCQRAIGEQGAAYKTWIIWSWDKMNNARAHQKRLEHSRTNQVKLPIQKKDAPSANVIATAMSNMFPHTTTRYLGRTRRAPQHSGGQMTGKQLEKLALHCGTLSLKGLAISATEALGAPNWKTSLNT